MCDAVYVYGVMQFLYFQSLKMADFGGVFNNFLDKVAAYNAQQKAAIFNATKAAFDKVLADAGAAQPGMLCAWDCIAAALHFVLDLCVCLWRLESRVSLSLADGFVREF